MRHRSGKVSQPKTDALTTDPRRQQKEKNKEKRMNEFE